MSNVIKLSQAKRSGGQGDHPLAAGGKEETNQVLSMDLNGSSEFVHQTAADMSIQFCEPYRGSCLKQAIKSQRELLEGNGIPDDSIMAQLEQFERNARYLAQQYDHHNFIEALGKFNVLSTKMDKVTYENFDGEAEEVQRIQFDVHLADADDTEGAFLVNAAELGLRAGIRFGFNLIEVRGFTDVKMLNDHCLQHSPRIQGNRVYFDQWIGFTPLRKKIDEVVMDEYEYAF